MKASRILVVGTGLIGKQRARAVQALSSRGAALAGTVDPVTPATPGPAPHWARVEDVPADAYDAAVVAVPHDVAADITVQVLSRGKPVLVEKPLGTDLRTARRIAEAARAVTTPSFVGYNYRFVPNVRDLLAAAPGLGRLRSLDLMLGHGGHPRSAEGWKLDPARAGGGVLLDPGVHLLDLALVLDPRLEPKAVHATRGFWKTGVEEDLVAVLTHDALIASVRVSHVRWVNGFRVELVGEDGYAIAEGRGGNYGAMTLRLGRRWAWNDGGGRGQRETEETRDFGPSDPSLHDELSAVLDRWQARSDGAAPASIDDGLRVAELCDTMYRMLGDAR